MFETLLIRRRIVISKTLTGGGGRSVYLRTAEEYQVFYMADIPESPTLHQCFQKILELQMYLRFFRASNGYLLTYQ